MKNRKKSLKHLLKSRQMKYILGLLALLFIVVVIVLLKNVDKKPTNEEQPGGLQVEESGDGEYIDFGSGLEEDDSEDEGVESGNKDDASNGSGNKDDASNGSENKDDASNNDNENNDEENSGGGNNSNISQDTGEFGRFF